MEVTLRIGAGIYRYLAFFKGKKVEVFADSLYEAKQKARQYFVPRKRDEGLLAIELLETPLGKVIHKTSEI